MADIRMSDDLQIPNGFTLRQKFQNGQGINRVAWSPDGEMLAMASRGVVARILDMKTQTSRQLWEGKFGYSVGWSPDSSRLVSGGVFRFVLWDVATEEVLWEQKTTSKANKYVAWSPDGSTLAVGSDDGEIHLWSVETRELLRTLSGHSRDVNYVTWSPDGSMIASCSDDATIRLWDGNSGQCIWTSAEHFSRVHSVVWSLGGAMLASASSDNTIRLWNSTSGQQIGILEGHQGPVVSISFSFDGRLLASKSLDNTVRIWRAVDQVQLVSLPEPSVPYGWYGTLAFHPKKPLLATLGEKDTSIRIWHLDLKVLLGDVSYTPSVHYRSAKVVLLGDSGVGKTSLSLVLRNQPYVPTESTHGLLVWTFDEQEIELDDEIKEIREIFLWDLAGQPNYRLIHQLHLRDVSLALLVFDAHGQTNPLLGVYHWNRALRSVQDMQKDPEFLIKKFLVATRIDAGRGINASRISLVKDELQFAAYIETSAKQGIGVVDVIREIKEAVDWERLPKVSSTNLFHKIKDFLIEEKQEDRVLASVDDLCREFLKSHKDFAQIEDIKDQFETCVRLVESQGLIQRLSFGDFILLKPELLDVYASAVIDAVNDEPDDVGSIAEEKVLTADFFIPEKERLADRKQEKLLLIAVIDDLLRHGIALREESKSGRDLIFPTQVNRENPNLHDPEGKAVIFSFEGTVSNIYATLVVNLAHSGLFKKEGLWKNAVTFQYVASESGKEPQTCGIFLQDAGDGHGELTLFFDRHTSKEISFLFEHYVHVHLQHHALKESIQRHRIFSCHKCGEPFTDSAVRHRRARGFAKMKCGVCETTVSILESNEKQFIEPVQQSLIKMSNEIAARREYEENISANQGRSQTKMEANEFDVFFSYNHEDRGNVLRIARQLRDRGIASWVDEWELRPGFHFSKAIQQQIRKAKSAAVFVGKSGIGPWQTQEVEGLLSEFVERECPVIPVLLKNAPGEKPPLPPFLKSMTWVDFRTKDDNENFEGNSGQSLDDDEQDFPAQDPMDRLVWGITGERMLI